jgi:hypothetical protein
LRKEQKDYMKKRMDDTNKKMQAMVLEMNSEEIEKRNKRATLLKRGGFACCMLYMAYRKLKWCLFNSLKPLL